MERITQGRHGTDEGVDVIAEIATVEILSNIFNHIAYMDAETVRENIEMACYGGFEPSDRTIPKEVGDWIMDNFSLIFLGLIVNQDFRDAMMEAVSVEIGLEERDDGFIKRIRDEMGSSENLEGMDNYLIDLGRYSDDMYRYINGRLADSFGKITDFGETVDIMISELSEDDMIDIGFCVSNFMFLLRAFAQNGVFREYIKTVVETVSKTIVE